MLPARRANWLPGIFNDFFGNEWIERSSVASPAVNIYEDENKYMVEIAAPGLTKEDFKIELHDENRMTVSVEKSAENDQKDKEGKYLRREFSYSQFRQSLILPEDTEFDRIGAKVENGILMIDIPKKRQEEKPQLKKTIEIK